AGPLDLDVFAEPGLAFETALRIGESRIVRSRQARAGEVVDDDVLCEVDARLRLAKDVVLVRRLNLIGSVDADPAAGTFGSCRLSNPDAGRLELRVSEGRVALASFKPVLATAHVVSRVPMAVMNRIAKGPFRGWAG